MNGSSYPFEKNHRQFEQLEPSVRENSSAIQTAQAIGSKKNQPFEQLEPPVGEIHQPFEWLELSVQERNSKLFWQPFTIQDKTRLQNNLPGFTLHKQSSRFYSLLPLLNDTRVIFLQENV